MRTRIKCVAVVAVMAVTACHSKHDPVDDPNRPGAEERALLDNATELTLFAIDPSGEAPGAELYGHPIRKTVVIPRDQIRRVAKAMATALGKGAEATCFEPHHALRVVSGGETVDLVICFACHEVEVMRDGKLVNNLAIDRSAELMLGTYVGLTPDVEEGW